MPERAAVVDQTIEKTKREIIAAEPKAAMESVRKAQLQYEKSHGLNNTAFKEQAQMSEAEKRDLFLKDPAAYIASRTDAVRTFADNVHKGNDRPLLESQELTKAAELLFSEGRSDLGKRVLLGAIDALDDRREQTGPLKYEENFAADTARNGSILSAAGRLELIAKQLQARNPRAAEANSSVARELRKLVPEEK